MTGARQSAAELEAHLGYVSVSVCGGRRRYHECVRLLRESRERLRASADGSPGPVAVLELTFRPTLMDRLEKDAARRVGVRQARSTFLSSIT